MKGREKEKEIKKEERNERKEGRDTHRGKGKK